MAMSGTVCSLRDAQHCAPFVGSPEPARSPLLTDKLMLDVLGLWTLTTHRFCRRLKWPIAQTQFPSLQRLR